MRRGSEAGAAIGVSYKSRRFGSLEIDRDARSVMMGGKLCELTSRRFDLLVAPAERAGRAQSARPDKLFGTPHFFWLLDLASLAVALGSYPIIRRLTQQLKALQRGFERWGDSDLSARVSADSKNEVAFLGQRFNQAAQRIESLMNSHKSLLANASRKLLSPLS